MDPINSYYSFVPQEFPNSMDYSSSSLSSTGNFSGNISKGKIDKEVERLFKPEFLNRLNDIIIFHPLNRENLLQVIELEIKKLQKRLEKRHLFITLDSAAENFLVDKGFQPEMGARPLRRTIEQYLEDPLAEKLLLNPSEGRRCLITVEHGEIVFIDQEVFPLLKDKDK